MLMLSGDREACLLFITCPEMENNRSHGTGFAIVAGKVRHLKAGLATRSRDGA